MPGATTSTLEIEEFKPENIGAYKLRVRWGECYEVTSSAATLGNSAPLIGLAQGNSDTGAQIFVSSFAGEKVIQGSTDLKVWTDIAASEADAWGYSIPIQEEFRFFRVKGAGAEIED